MSSLPRSLTVLFLATLLLAGCPLRQAATTNQPTAKSDNTSTSDLRLALDALRKLAEGADADPVQRTIFYLNQWLSSYEPAKAEWKEDRLIEGLRGDLRSTPGMERLPKLQFTADDITYLQQSIWLHDIATRVRKEPPPPALAPWLKEIEKSVGLPEAEQLAAAERVFDWTVRNLQLDPLPPPPKGATALAGSATEATAPALAGELGPGYGHVPLQLLLYGQGDALERGRIFLLLCRQLGIDVVMLGLKEPGAVAPRAWTPAVLAGGQLYLFEPSLGLPIPGPDGKGIATLDQIWDDPQLLRQLDVEGLPAYPVGEQHLKTGDKSNLFALIDAEPAALTRRMQQLQSVLPRELRLALSVQPRQLQVKLQTAKRIPAENVTLWRVPFEALLYQIGYQQVLATDQKAAQDFARLAAVFAADRPLTKARNFHLQGRFENEDSKKMARSLYMECRPPENEIRAMETNEYFRSQIGIDQALPKDPAQRQAYLEHFTSIARAGKFNASYWIALTYYESGKYDTVIDWLSQRTVLSVPESPWTPGARYNIARSYEQLGKLDLAKQWLLSDAESPQRHGNRLRAKWLTSH